ncbi:MAG: glycosyltransferase family 9 protein [Bdellovibrio sp.]|nr:glycosyltransferase family 9 protein [Bdellovibrio sp.]
MSLRILVVRPDRLGDVILSTPVFEALHESHSDLDVTAFVQASVVPILKGLDSIQDVMVFEPHGRHRGVRGFLALVQDLRRKKFDIALTLQSNRRIAAALFFARIPIRIGPYSKIHSYLFYNKGLRQRRSRVEMHEADYNLELLKKTGLPVTSEKVSTRVFISGAMHTQAKKWLGEKGSTLSHGKWVAVHPGMGGSALNWPLDHYTLLIRSLIEAGKNILVTLGPAEVDLALLLKARLGSFGSRIVYYQANAGDPIDFLGALYSLMDLVVAPSTGPLHLAVGVGRPVVTFYPNIKVQSKERWGPYTKQADQARVLVPDVDCTLNSSCMSTVTVHEVLKACDEILSRNSTSTSK